MSDILRYQTAPANSLLNGMGETTLLTANLSLEVDQIAFKLIAEDGKALIIAESFTDVWLLTKKLLIVFPQDTLNLKTIEAALDRMNLTVFVQNRFMGIMGPKANPILRKLFFLFVARKS